MDRLLRPTSVAVVGASPNPSFVSMILTNLLRHGFAGQVVAVNPKYERILHAPCYPSLLDVPHPVDLVVVGIGAHHLPALLEQCEQKRVGALEIITSGFAETGPAGARRQAELCAWARRTGIVVGGPNCLGLLHAPSGLHALPTNVERLHAGAVSVILQSGMMAPTVLAPLFARGIGVSFAVTSGNEADLEAADYLRYFVEDDQTRVIGLFAEQFKTPQRFLEACELAAERQKPIVALKIGRSEGGRRAALAHTGSLVGSDEVVDAVLRRHGVSRVWNVDELIEQLAVFHAPRLPRGPGVAAVIVSGGAAGLLSDLAPECGVRFPDLPEATAQQLRRVVPEYGNVGNPLDITGQGVFATDILGHSLDLLAQVPDIHTIIYGRSFPAYLDRQAPVTSIIEQAIASYPDKVFLALSLVGGHFYPGPNPDVPVVEPIDRLGGIPFLQGSQAGLQAVGALVRYAEFQRARQQRAAPSRRVSAEVADRARALVVEAQGRLTERQGKQVLAMYGIPTTRERLATSLEEARAAAAEIGYPVALKVESADLRHKTQAGAVALGLVDQANLAEGYARVLANARQAARQAALAGVLVQEMVPAGCEVIVGMSHDPQFGPVIACGLGGVFVEVLRDVQLMLPPLIEAEVRPALERLRAFRVLQEGADLDALVEVLLRFSDLCLDLAEVVQEIDINPLMVLPHGATAVDCLLVPLAEGAGEPKPVAADPSLEA